LFDLAGRQVAVARRRTSILRPAPGWCEVDPEEVWAAARAVLREVVASSGVPATSIAALGLSAAMVGAWVVDGEGTALRPGVNWEDSRSQALIDRHIADDPGFLHRIFRSTGSVMQQGCTLPVLAWLAENEPEVLSRASHVFGYKDYLRMRLTGLAATDRTEAAVAPGSAVARGRSAEMIALFALEPQAHLLPPVLDSETVHGGLLPEVAAEIGLPAGLPVAVGSGDVPANIIGAGGLEAGSSTALLGTTCMAGVCHDRPVFEPPDVGLLFTLPGNRWYRSMVNVAGTLNLDWAFDALAPDLAERPDRYERLNEMVAGVPDGADGLVFLPYLSESGIIAPVVSYAARAQFSGLTPRHGRAALFRAVLEGVAFAMRDLLDALGFDGDRVRLTGGGAQNPFWVQMIADLIGKPVVVPEGKEFGARGAAIMAATAVGRFDGIVAASRALAPAGTEYRPNPDRGRSLAPALARYREARDRLLGIA
jgi:sugar (pentulose or hexulose) kinase